MIGWLAHSLRGVCMGIADVIPGVSGGTLALILGIYERFIGAVSALGPGLLRVMLTRAFWVAIIAHLKDPKRAPEGPTEEYAAHMVFLGFIAIGMVSAILVGARFIPHLLDIYPAQMKGFFFGLVLASVVIPFRQMKKPVAAHIAPFILAAIGTYFIVGMPVDTRKNAQTEVQVTLPAPSAEARVIPRANVVFLTHAHGGKDKREVAFGPRIDVEIPAGITTFALPVTARLAGDAGNIEPGALVQIRGLDEGATISQTSAATGGTNPALWLIFIAGVVAISAMVLPGVSGSFMLLMFGLYHYITFTLRLAVYERDPDAMVVIGVFLVALAVGITTFSRVLNVLLHRAHDATMAALMGLMLGSLRRLWPWMSTGADGLDQNAMPIAWDTAALTAVGLAVLGGVIVTALERFGRKSAAV